MNYSKVAEEILELVGGKTNISFATYCITRLRLTLKDRGLIQDEKIRELKEVVTTKEVGSQYQIIIGPEVEHVYKAFCKLAELKETAKVDEVLDQELVKPKENRSLWQKIKDGGSLLITTLSGIFVPLIPAMLGASFVKVILIVLDKFFGINGEVSQTYALLDVLQNSFFYYMPVLVAWSAAKKAGANMVLTLMIVGFLINPSTAALLADGGVKIFGIPVTTVTYTSSVIPAIFTAYLVAKVENVLKKYIPSMLRTMFVPVLTLLIVATIMLTALGPIGYWLGLLMANVLKVLYNVSPILSGALIGGLWNGMIVVGMHMVVLQMVRNVNIAMNGVDYVCVACVAGITCNIAAGLAVAFRTKDKKLKKEAFELALTSLFAGNIIEPVMYGINIKYKKPFYFTMIGGAVGGIIISLAHAGVYAPVIFSIYSLPAYFGEGFWGLIAGVLIACAVTFVLTYKFGLDEKTIKGEA